MSERKVIGSVVNTPETLAALKSLEEKGLSMTIELKGGEKLTVQGDQIFWIDDGDVIHIMMRDSSGDQRP